MKSIVEPAREIPVIREVDVCVLGGGPSGIIAALQAAAHGAKTLLVERYGFLGGMATAGMVGPILGLREVGSENATAGAMTEQFCRRMADIGGATQWEESVRAGRVAFDVEAYKVTADRMCTEFGVDLLLHCVAVDSVVEAGVLRAVVVESKSGRQAIAAKCFIDTTGDADVAFRAGAECTKGRPADGLMMAMGSMFRVGGMQPLSEDQAKAAREIITRARDEGLFTTYHSGLGGQGSVLQPGDASCNITRFAGDATDVEDLTRGEVFIREQVWRIVEFWRNNIPGLEDVHLIGNPPNIGIRETRQLVGLDRVTGEDVIAGRKRDDAIARCSYWIDIHCPRGLGDGGVHLCYKQCPNTSCYMLTDYAEQLPDELHPPDYFDIPYGSLVPVEIDGLLVGGRCISADYQAMSAARVMAPCMAIGDACGVAAAMAVDAGVTPRKLDVAALRSRLRNAGAVC